MINDTLRRIEQRLQESSLESGEKDRLQQLLVQLRSELENLPEESAESASSVAAYAEIATLQATREGGSKESKLIEHASEGMSLSLAGFEQEHPGLTRAVNQFCEFLSGMGI